jgi:hypothetical protein
MRGKRTFGGGIFRFQVRGGKKIGTLTAPKFSLKI